MMAGLQGAGKTTFTGKLANYLKKMKMLVRSNRRDVYRPTAIDQLKVLGQQLDVPVFDMGTEVSPVEIVRHGMELAKRKEKRHMMIDTAGRLHIDETLMDELKQIKELTQPNEILLVVDAMTGQDAVNVADSFNQQLGITGSSSLNLMGILEAGSTIDPLSDRRTNQIHRFW